MKPASITLRDPFFNLEPSSSVANRSYTHNVGNIPIHSFGMDHYATFKPDRNFTNPEWWIQKLVNW